MRTRRLLGAGFAIMVVGQFLANGLDVNHTSLTSLIVPSAGRGGFRPRRQLDHRSLDQHRAAALRRHASATTNLLRDFGFTLGPAVIGAVALSKAATFFTPGLPRAGLQADQVGAAQAVAEEGGPGSGAHAVAMSALGHGYVIGYAVCAAAALVAAIHTVVAMHGGTHDHAVEAESLVDEAQCPSGSPR